MTDPTNPSIPKWLNQLIERSTFYLVKEEQERQWAILRQAIPPGLPEAVLTRIRYRLLHNLLQQKVLHQVAATQQATRNLTTAALMMFDQQLRAEATTPESWQNNHIAVWFTVASKQVAQTAETNLKAVRIILDAAAQDQHTNWAFSVGEAAAIQTAVWATLAAGPHTFVASEADAIADTAAQAALDKFYDWTVSQLLALITEESKAWAAKTT